MAAITWVQRTIRLTQSSTMPQSISEYGHMWNILHC